MSPTVMPARITIDFRDAVDPSRSWILGLGTAARGRVDLIAFDRSPVSPSDRLPVRSVRSVLSHPTALIADCSCPDFCERDHANE